MSYANFEDIDLDAFINEKGYFHKDEALFFAFEMAYEDRNLGLSPKDFLKKRMSFQNEIQLNWGIALEIYINYLLRAHSKGSKSIN